MKDATIVIDFRELDDRQYVEDRTRSALRAVERARTKRGKHVALRSLRRAQAKLKAVLDQEKWRSDRRFDEAVAAWQQRYGQGRESSGSGDRSSDGDSDDESDPEPPPRGLDLKDCGIPMVVVVLPKGRGQDD